MSRGKGAPWWRLTAATSLVTAGVVAAYVVATAACHKQADQKGQGSGMPGDLVSAAESLSKLADSLDAHDAHAGDRNRDPCTLVSRQEAEAFLGPLLHDPYRAKDAIAGDPGGSLCVYRGATGRSINIAPDWTDGKLSMKMYGMMAKMIGSVIKDQSGKADTLGGDWDEVRWDWPGELYVLKGDVFLDIDVGATRMGPAEAVKLAEEAMPRITKPLSYDGSVAAQTAPGPLVPPREPCSLLTRKQVEAILGPLTGNPRAVQDECRYPVHRNPMLSDSIALTVKWTGGFHEMNEQKAAGGIVKAQFDNTLSGGGNGSPDRTPQPSVGGRTRVAPALPGGIPGLEKNRAYQRQLNKLDSLSGGHLDRNRMMLKTDTTGLVGPWEEAGIINGLMLMAVKKDVFMLVDLRTLPTAQGVALMTEAMKGI